MKAKNKLLTLLTLAAGAATATAVINKCIKVSATSKNLLAETKSLCYKWRFGNIHYTKTGSGKPILLASHNDEDIRILCDHVYEMDGGVLRERTA